MTDVFDRAQEREEEMRHDALVEQERRAQAGHGAESARICTECDGPIPEARRQAVLGVQTCVECQTFIEKQGRFDWGVGE